MFFFCLKKSLYTQKNMDLIGLIYIFYYYYFSNKICIIMFVCLLCFHLYVKCIKIVLIWVFKCTQAYRFIIYMSCFETTLVKSWRIIFWICSIYVAIDIELPIEMYNKCCIVLSDWCQCIGIACFWICNVPLNSFVFFLYINSLAWMYSMKIRK